MGFSQKWDLIFFWYNVDIFIVRRKANPKKIFPVHPGGWWFFLLPRSRKSFSKTFFVTFSIFSTVLWFIKKVQILYDLLIHLFLCWFVQFPCSFVPFLVRMNLFSSFHRWFLWFAFSFVLSLLYNICPLFLHWFVQFFL